MREAVVGRWRGWREFSIERIEQEVPDIRSCYLRAVDGEALCQPLAGQFVTVKMAASPGPVIRCWSLSDHSPDMDRYRLTVKRQSGAGSSWLHEAEPGAILHLRPPSGEFVLEIGSRPVILAAAGIGITPLFAMLKAHLARPDAIPIHLLYGGRTPGTIAFRAELDALAGAYRHFWLTYAYSRADTPSRVTADLLVEKVSRPLHEQDFYICGPGDFCAQLTMQLAERGADPARLFTELFQEPPLV